MIGIAGWFADENKSKIEELIYARGIRSVAEIGSFLGLSAVWFAQRDIVEHVYCIDTWYEGAMRESENNLLGTLRRWDLPRDFFGIFRDNVMRSGVWHKIHPFRGESNDIRVHRQLPEVDLVYIDGDHSYAGCKRDIEIYLTKARKIICGDDYSVRMENDGTGLTPAFGVIQAVTELLPDHQHVGPFWWAEVGK